MHVDGEQGRRERTRVGRRKMVAGSLPKDAVGGGSSRDVAVGEGHHVVGAGLGRVCHVGDAGDHLVGVVGKAVVEVSIDLSVGQAGAALGGLLLGGLATGLGEGRGSEESDKSVEDAHL